MREILFKGKCIDETCLKGQWLEGYILHDGVTGKYYIHRDNCLNESDNVGEEGLLRFVAYEVDPETVCQYTGIANENEKKIFEGDICEFSVFDYNGHDIQYKGVVVYSGSRFMLWHSKESEYYGDDGGFDLDWVISQDDEFEVVGNIFDNPELI